VYFYLHRNLYSTFEEMASVTERIPIFFIYGEKNPLLFYSDTWKSVIAQRAGCQVASIPADHWFPMRSKVRDQVSELIASWLCSAFQAGRL